MTKNIKKHRVTHRADRTIIGCTLLAEGDQPELYHGPVPSFSALSFIAQAENAHREWQMRRAAMRKNWWYNPRTGNAEPIKVKRVTKRRELEAA